MCGRPLWGIVGAAICGYFSYSAFTDLRDGDYYWAAGWWVVLTWAIWLVFAAGLLSEVRCWREGIFFFLLVLVFLTGLIFSAWSSARASVVREAREASLALWGVAGLASLMTMWSPDRSPKK